MPVGERFKGLYEFAADSSPPDQVLHLCFPDRLAFALQSEHRADFMDDVRSLDPTEPPLIYQRSERAWETHPVRYREIEDMVTHAGELLFGKSLDYAWCHIAIRAGDLRGIIAGVSEPGMPMLAEIILLLRERINTRDVDWLAWEDPFILERDPDELKSEREISRSEIHKRLSYAIPMLHLLEMAARTENA